MHASRRRGKSQQRILYWFRSPPNVKVGRAALDEDAIRWIEEHNPDVTFDWPKILEVEPPSPKASASLDVAQERSRTSRDAARSGVGPPAPAPPADARRRRHAERSRGGRDRAREGGQGRREETAPPLPQTVESQVEEAIEQIEMEQEIERLNPEAESDAPPITEMTPILPILPIMLINDAREPEPDAPRPAVEPAVSKLLSREQLMSFRARFAELQARITERAGSPERMEALRARAEGLNPDTWVTEQDVRKGMADFEPQVRDLRASLGLRNRRRSRRGGRRHRRAGAEAQPQGAPETSSLGPQEISPSPFSDEPNGDDDV